MKLDYPTFKTFKHILSVYDGDGKDMVKHGELLNHKAIAIGWSNTKKTPTKSVRNGSYVCAPLHKNYEEITETDMFNPLTDPYPSLLARGTWLDFHTAPSHLHHLHAGC